MGKKNKDDMAAIVVILGAILGIVMIFGLSWLMICGFVKLITLCFGWSFSWLVATGIWLLIFMFNLIFKTKKKQERTRSEK